jgi:hypothetical protein
MNSKVELKDKPDYGNKEVLSNAFLLSCGFLRSRDWSDRLEQFRVSYTIEGYDCKIIVSPSPQVVPNDFEIYGKGHNLMPPEMQVDEFSDIEMLSEHHYGDFQIFVNSEKNHLATFEYQQQLIDLMRLCDCPLDFTQPK